MASIIPGFEYDIFISYRQKDNKYDGWVTEFVSNLRKELEATFKDDISIYFDENPHDGLLETHDVGESLKEKLKCLVFIPIISRTYCDTKSFAWENEFIAFVEQASKDQFGLKVKLPNGNVASRVLPVRIHDLDNEDIRLCESVLGSVLRGVEFIYKEPGINRSLSIKDNEEKNENNTSYRNQINKVTLAIKEIISGLVKASTGNLHKVSQHQKEPEIIPGKKSRRKPVPLKLPASRFYIVISVLVIILIAGLLMYPLLFKPDPLIMLMDSSLEKRVYDKEVLESGGTNADVISDILLDLPAKRQRELIGPLWHRDEEIVKFHPYLIIIHYSGFDPDNTTAHIRLKSFIRYFMDSDTRFLVYSRMKEAALKTEMDTLLSDLTRINPNLSSRIDVFGLDDHGSRSWKNQVTANELKLRVIGIMKKDGKLREK